MSKLSKITREIDPRWVSENFQPRNQDVVFHFFNTFNLFQFTFLWPNSNFAKILKVNLPLKGWFFFFHSIHIDRLFVLVLFLRRWCPLALFRGSMCTDGKTHLLTHFYSPLKNSWWRRQMRTDRHQSSLVGRGKKISKELQQHKILMNSFFLLSCTILGHILT